MKHAGSSVCKPWLRLNLPDDIPTIDEISEITNFAWSTFHGETLRPADISDKRANAHEVSPRHLSTPRASLWQRREASGYYDVRNPRGSMAIYRRGREMRQSKERIDALMRVGIAAYLEMLYQHVDKTND